MRKAAQGHANTEVLTPVIAIRGDGADRLARSDQTAARSVALMRHGFGGHPFGPDAAIQRERQRGRFDAGSPKKRAWAASPSSRLVSRLARSAARR